MKQKLCPHKELSRLKTSGNQSAVKVDPKQFSKARKLCPCKKLSGAVKAVSTNSASKGTKAKTGKREKEDMLPPRKQCVGRKSTTPLAVKCTKCGLSLHSARAIDTHVAKEHIGCMFDYKKDGCTHHFKTLTSL